MNKKINYLNNKDMLKEIHKSKNSYSEYTDKKYADYDIVIKNKEHLSPDQVILHWMSLPYEIDKITGEIISINKDNTRLIRAKRLAEDMFREAKGKNEKLSKKDLIASVLSTISEEDVVYRIPSYDHIPLASGRKKNPKSEADKRVKLNFKPFKHYILVNGEVKEVGRSHYCNGEFSCTHGNLTNRLSEMFIMLVDRYAQRANWRGYTYVDEMKGYALLQLAQMGLQFEESESENPFAYYTTFVNNSFTRVLNTEKRNQELRDDLLVSAGHNPSYTRQLEHEMSINSEYALQDNRGRSSWGHSWESGNE